MNHDNIIPRGTQGGRVTGLPVRIRTIVEYDAERLRDRVRSDIFLGDVPLGFYSVAEVNDELWPGGGTAEFAEMALRHYGDRTEESAVRHFVNTISAMPSQVAALEAQVAALTERLDTPWWKRAGRAVGRAHVDFWQKFHEIVTLQPFRRSK